MDESRVVTFDLMLHDPDYYFVLTEALREFASSQRTSAEYADDGEARIRWADTAEEMLDRIEEAVSTPGPVTDLELSGRHGARKGT